jgi:hypothetical protein
MTDKFDDFLAQALGPPERAADRVFLARVQSQIRLDEQLRAERRGMLSMLAIQVLGIAAIAAAVFWLLRSPAIGEFAAESPAILLTMLLAAFSFAVLLFSTGSARERSIASFSIA